MTSNKKVLILFIVSVIMSVNAKNPILPGFYPDPSICAVGEDYYLVNSSFAYFPGLPIMHSRDLAHWEQIGNALDRESQLPLNNAGVSQGLFAPTIRYNKGLFYIVCTNVSGGGNFCVTAENPAGPWSEPHYIEGADGIDPSLFFDTDDRCYYIGTHANPEGCRYNGDYFIYIQEFDYREFKLIGQRRDVWNGAMRDVHWPEGPHLYKVGDFYYLLHAEGGTGPEHAVCIARSRSVFGPYENNFCNPILTHRHLGKRYPIKYVGHADMFQTAKGDWYMVMLAVRSLSGYTTLGRETFLARIVWEDEWPLVNAGVGMLTAELKIDLPEWEQEYASNAQPGVNKSYDFTAMNRLGSEFMTLRKWDPDMVRFESGKGLLLKCAAQPVTGLGNISYLCLRQDSHFFDINVLMNIDNLTIGSTAGIMLYQNNEYNLRFEISNWIGYVIMTKGGIEEKLANVSLNCSFVQVSMRVAGLKASIYIRKDKAPEAVLTGIDISALSTEVAGGFVGCTAGIYAVDAEDRDEAVYARFISMSYNRIVPSLSK